MDMSAARQVVSPARPDFAAAFPAARAAFFSIVQSTPEVKAEMYAEVDPLDAFMSEVSQEVKANKPTSAPRGEELEEGRYQ